MKALLPFRTYVSPSDTAVVDIPNASEPAEGSVRANAPAPDPEARPGRNRLLCSSFPYRKIVSPTMLVTAIPTEVDAQPPAISASASA